jgi:hypothetical protein
VVKKDDPPPVVKKDDPPPGDSIAKGSFPRRLLVVSVNNYPFANPVGYGSGERALDKIVHDFANVVRVPNDQVAMLSDRGQINVPAMPPTKEVVEQIMEQFLTTSRAQDRVILMFVGHAVEIDETPYLMPLDGETDKADNLIPLSWLYGKLAACPAQQKVLILDVCRFSPTRGEERGAVAAMGEKTDAMLAKPPKGVQVLTACTAGQRSLEIDDKVTQNEGLVDGGIFLNRISILKQAGGIKGLTQKPDDPFPFEELMFKLRSTTPMAKAYYGQAQTPRLSGEEVKKIPFDAKAALPPALTPKLPDRFKNGVLGARDIDSVFKVVAAVPPVKRGEKTGSFSADGMPPYPKDAIKDYKDDGVDTPFREAVKEGIKALNDSDKTFAVNETFTKPANEQQLNMVKKQIEGIQKDKVGEAFFVLNKVAEELEERKAGKDKESKFWQANYDYVLARLYARQAFILEYNVMLGKIRRDDLPMLDPAVHKGWKLAAKKDLSDKDAKENADKSKKLLEKLAQDHKGTPWELIGKREGITALGMEWQPN